VYPGAFRAFVRPITVSRSEFHLTRYPVKSFTGLGETARSLPRLPPSMKTDALIDSCVYETNETNKDASLRSARVLPFSNQVDRGFLCHRCMAFARRFATVYVQDIRTTRA